MNRLLIIVLLLSWGWTSKAQVQAPDFLCVSNDTLNWELPTIDCGTLTAYRIWSSENRNGPYTELATINDISQTSFFHADAGIVTWFYYLESEADCPGELIQQSDTLDNRNPETPEFQFVTVADGQVEMSWEASPSPEVVAYVISRNTSMGTSIIDTVANGLSYTDANASPDVGKETYFVVAIDACGNASLTAPLHETLFLETNALDSCEQTIVLSWNLYQNWNGGIGSHTVLMSENGGTFNTIASLDGTATSYDFDQARGEVLYCFKVIAEEAGTGIVSVSNETCTTISVVDPVDRLDLLNATVTLNNEIALDWEINANAELSSATLNVDLGSSNSTQSLLSGQGLAAENTYVDTQTDPNIDFAIYSIATEDLCGDLTSSNSVQTIFLRVEAGEASINRLQWTPYQNALAKSIEYEIYRVIDGVETLVSVETTSTLSLNDEPDIGGANSLEVCYFILAKIRIQLPDGGLRSVVSRSNTVCVMPVAPFYIPNAFAPEGVNQVFRPELAFGMLEEYQMDIFDRWGGHVFLSRDIELGWNGQKNGQIVAAGLYIYRIQWRQTSGELQEVSGGVVLMY